MAKSFIIYTISLTVLIFVTGCPQPVTEPAQPPIVEAEPITEPAQPPIVEPEPITEPAPPEQPKTQPAEAEPAPIEPAPVEPPKAEPPVAESPKAEPAKTEPAETTAAKPEPPKAEPPVVESPKAEPIKVESKSTVTFHDKCAYIFNNFVDEKGMVNYKALKRKRHKLNTLLNEFATLKADVYNSWPQDDKIAFWLNACNIQMLKIIVENYPIKSTRYLRVLWPPTSIRHISPIRRIGTAKWDSYKFIVMDEAFTLSEIEQRFLGKQFKDPRIFLAIFNGARYGPPLRNEPYYGHKLDKQLNDQAKKFLANPRAFRIDRKKQTVHLSAIFEATWYGKHFVDKYGTNKKYKDYPYPVRAVLNFAAKYIPQQEVSYLEVENYSVRFIGYDWRLNDSSAAVR